MSAADVADAEQLRMRKRRRGPYACSLCRQRKVRCDGNNPCANCSSADSECVYGSEPVTKGKSDTLLDKSDAILESLLRLDDRLNYLTEVVTSNASPTTFGNGAVAAYSPQTATSTEPSLLKNTRILTRDPRNDERRLENASMSAQHTSTTESVLAWGYFDSFPGLRQEYQPIFTLEQQRSSVADFEITELPSTTSQEVKEIIGAFQGVVNFAYPTLAADSLEDIERRILEAKLDNNLSGCHALLIMALGCASLVVRDLGDSAEPHPQRSRDLALVYFGLTLRRFHLIQLDVSTIATQCLFFTALFFAYLQRPLQAWSYISMAASKCRLLLSYASADAGTDTECLRRIFWSCYILESDYVAELSALPQTGIAEIESLIPFPGYYPSALSNVDRENSSLYFLACVSMRRLLNRVHDLLYAPDTGVGLDDARFPHIVTELDHQLEEWRDCLPAAFCFTMDTQPAVSSHGGFLRQRYLTCRAVIYRPYLNHVLARFSAGEHLPAPVLDKSQVCLNMCLLHILNLRAFPQTVLIDTWICSLSMATTMLMLLAASRIPELKERLGTRVLQAGPHLTQLIEPWLHVHGEQPSPSVEQSWRMIRDIEILIRRQYT